MTTFLPGVNIPFSGSVGYGFSPARCCCCLNFIDDFERDEIGPNWYQYLDHDFWTPTSAWTISGGALTCSTAGAVIQTELFVIMPGDPLIEFDIVSMSGVFVFGRGTSSVSELGLVFNGSTVEAWAQDGNVFGLFDPSKRAEATIGSPPYHVEVCNRGDQTYGIWINGNPLFAYAGQMPFQPQFKIKSGSATIDNVKVFHRHRTVPTSGRYCGICQTKGWFPVGNPDEIAVTISGLSCAERNGTFILTQASYPVGGACWLFAGSTGNRQHWDLTGDFGLGATKMILTVPARTPSIYLNWTDGVCTSGMGVMQRAGFGSLPVGATTVIGNTLSESFSGTGPAYWQRDSACTGSGTITIEAVE